MEIKLNFNIGVHPQIDGQSTDNSDTSNGCVMGFKGCSDEQLPLIEFAQNNSCC